MLRNPFVAGRFAAAIASRPAPVLKAIAPAAAPQDTAAMLMFGFRRARAALTLLATAGSALALSSSPALAASSYGCTGSTQNATVPNGAVSASIKLQGASGAGNKFGVNGGVGASVDVTMPVTPGQTLTFDVGCQDGYGGGGTAGDPYEAGNGGGATTVTYGVVLYGVAGGGGGAGGQSGNPADPRGVYGGGGAGGNADANGSPGTSGTRDPGAYAGLGGHAGDFGAQGGLGGRAPASCISRIETLAAGAGRHSLALGNDLTGRQLEGGNYRLVIQSQHGKARSRAVTMSFTIVTSHGRGLTLG